MSKAGETLGERWPDWTVQPHNPDKIESTKCLVCGKGFQSRRLLATHKHRRTS